MMGAGFKADRPQCPQCALLALTMGNAGEAQGIHHVSQRRPPEHDGSLEYHRLAALD